MDKTCIGVDTSCYTTSIACVCKEGIVFEQRTMLSVPLGNRGLRQSDAVFQHVRNLPALVDSLFAQIDRDRVASVAVSATPTAQEDSYMPVFLAGKSVATAISGALQVPLIETTHQAGHVRAALLGNEMLLERQCFLALHVSGGTTDVLLVHTKENRIDGIDPIGCSDDLHAGQFVDRIGVRLGLAFPCGPHLEELAIQAQQKDLRLPSTVRGMHCSLSGQETQAIRLLEQGQEAAEVAYAVYECLARTIGKLLDHAVETYGEMPVLFSGGVSGSLLLRKLLNNRTKRVIHFAGRGLSSDNAVGAALLALDQVEQNENA